VQQQNCYRTSVELGFKKVLTLHGTRVTISFQADPALQEEPPADYPESLGISGGFFISAAKGGTVKRKN
jgi:hypothetical protein